MTPSTPFARTVKFVAKKFAKNASGRIGNNVDIARATSKWASVRE